MWCIFSNICRGRHKVTGRHWSSSQKNGTLRCIFAVISRCSRHAAQVSCYLSAPLLVYGLLHHHTSAAQQQQQKQQLFTNMISCWANDLVMQHQQNYQHKQGNATIHRCARTIKSTIIYTYNQLARALYHASASIARDWPERARAMDLFIHPLARTIADCSPAAYLCGYIREPE